MSDIFPLLDLDYDAISYIAHQMDGASRYMFYMVCKHTYTAAKLNQKHFKLWKMQTTIYVSLKNGYINIWKFLKELGVKFVLNDVSGCNFKSVDDLRWMLGELDRSLDDFEKQKFASMVIKPSSLRECDEFALTLSPNRRLHNRAYIELYEKWGIIPGDVDFWHLVCTNPSSIGRRHAHKTLDYANQYPFPNSYYIAMLFAAFRTSNSFDSSFEFCDNVLARIDTKESQTITWGLSKDAIRLCVIERIEYLKTRKLLLDPSCLGRFIKDSRVQNCHVSFKFLWKFYMYLAVMGVKPPKDIFTDPESKWFENKHFGLIKLFMSYNVDPDKTGKILNGGWKEFEKEELRAMGFA